MPRASSLVVGKRREKEFTMLALGMVLLGLVMFAAMLAFVKLCDRV
jgi:hypothetical protein